MRRMKEEFETESNFVKRVFCSVLCLDLKKKDLKDLFRFFFFLFSIILGA